MTEDEIQTVFHRNLRESKEFFEFQIHSFDSRTQMLKIINCLFILVDRVDYEVVQLFHRNERSKVRVRRSSMEKIQVRAFSQNYNLYLEENDNVLFGQNTPVFLAGSNNFAYNSSEPPISLKKIQFVSS